MEAGKVEMVPELCFQLAFEALRGNLFHQKLDDDYSYTIAVYAGNCCFLIGGRRR